MFCKSLFKLLMALVICFAVPSAVFAEPEDGTVKKEEGPKVTSKIFLIIVDGLQGETLQKTSAPNINGIANAGVRVSNVIPVFPDSTEAVVASVLTGLMPEKHQFTGDKVKGATLQQLMENKKINTSFFGADGEIKNLMAPGGHNCSGPFNGKDELVMNNVLAEWAQSQSYFNVLLLPELRAILEQQGAKSNEYKMAVTRTDAQIGRLLKKLHEEDIYDNSMLIITGTSGAPPLIMSGLPFKESAQIPPVSICDIAPTVGYLNGVNLGKTDGLVLWNTFKEIGGQNEEYLMNERIKDLSLANAHLLQEMNRLQDEKFQVKQQQEIVAREKEDIQRQIEVRDQKIEGLKGRISFYHIGAVALLGILGAGYFVLYKLLRKRFLMF